MTFGQALDSYLHDAEGGYSQKEVEAAYIYYNDQAEPQMVITFGQNESWTPIVIEHHDLRTEISELRKEAEALRKKVASLKREQSSIQAALNKIAKYGIQPK